jgi:hypothetical protein
MKKLELSLIEQISGGRCSATQHALADTGCFLIGAAFEVASAGLLGLFAGYGCALAVTYGCSR